MNNVVIVKDKTEINFYVSMSVEKYFIMIFEIRYHLIYDVEKCFQMKPESYEKSVSSRSIVFRETNTDIFLGNIDDEV